MTILGANGKPITAQRKVYLSVDIIDQQPGAAQAQRSHMGFELDSTDPTQIAILLRTITQSVTQRLTEIGFTGPVPGRVAVEAVTEEKENETLVT